MSYSEKVQELQKQHRDGVLTDGQFNLKLQELNKQDLGGRVTPDDESKAVVPTKSTPIPTESTPNRRGRLEEQKAVLAQGTTGSTTSRATPDDFMPVSSPAMTKAAIRAARRYAQVPSNLSDSEAISGGFIPPELLALFMTIITDLLQNCLSNQPQMALRRMRGYTQETNEYKRMGDTVRLQWMANGWINRLGVPRDRGDVRMIAKALINEAGGITDEEFIAVQTEVLWLTV